jgi:hypothetical protein
MADAVGSDVKAIFWVSVGLAVTASAVDNGALAWVLGPVALLGVLFCAARAPLRYSLMGLMFSSFMLDNPNDQLANGYYHSPLFGIGAAMMDHLNNLTGIKPLFFSASDLVIAVMIVVGLSRESARSPIDRAGRTPTPRPQVRLAQLALGGAGYVWIAGMVRGGEFSWSLWQLHKVIYLPILFLLSHLGLRGKKDHVALAKLLLTAATLRAVEAVAIKKFVIPPVDPTTGLAQLAYTTSHADSMLFASAFVLLVLLVIERKGKRVPRFVLLLLPILGWGMLANNRRLVWVHVGAILLNLYLSMPDSPFKRKVRRGVYASIPLIGVYLMAGWNSQFGSLFKPVRMIRSVVDAQTDDSSLWRELENYNLIFTVRQSPIFGYGYGRKYIEAIPMPAVDYSLEYYCPHNSLLGLWAFAGYIGFTAITLMWGAGVYFAMRAYHAAKEPMDRVAATVCVGAVLVYLVQAFGDIGLGSFTGVYIVAPALAIAGKLAVETGMWGSTGRTAPAAANAGVARGDAELPAHAWSGTGRVHP